MPKVKNWEQYTDPESKDYSPATEELKEDEALMRTVMDELLYFEDMVEGRGGVYEEEGEDMRRINPNDIWDALAYAKIDFLDKIKYPEDRKKLEKELNRVEKKVYRQYIPHIDYEIDIFGYLNSPLEKKSTRGGHMTRDVMGVESLFEEAFSALDYLDLSEDKKTEFTNELERLQDKFNRYQKEPSLYTFERREREMHKELYDESFWGYRGKETQLGDDVSRAKNLEKLDEIIRQTQQLLEIAEGMKDKEIKESCVARAEGLHNRAEQKKLEFEAPREFAVLDAKARDLLYKIKNDEEVAEEDIKDIENNLETLKKSTAGSFTEIINKIQETIRAARIILKGGEPDEVRIDIDMESPDWAWELLGVSRDADFKKIKKRYKALVLRYHPDINKGDEEAEAKMRKINEAYEFVKRMNELEKDFYKIV